MAFYDRDYDVYVVLSSPESPDLWIWDRWKIVADLFAPFAEVPRGRAALRGNRYVPNPKKPGYAKSEGFGRIGWDQRSHEKWTFDSSLTKDRCLNWQFLNVEAWAPSWSKCVQESLAPDFYFAMSNQKMFGCSGRQLAFNPIFVIASSVSLADSYRLGLRKAVCSLSSNVSSKLLVSRTRPWGYPLSPGHTGFTGAIQDLPTTGLFKVGDPHQRPIDLNTFSELWSEVSRTVSASSLN